MANTDFALALALQEEEYLHSSTARHTDSSSPSMSSVNVLENMCASPSNAALSIFDKDPVKSNSAVYPLGKRSGNVSVAAGKRLKKRRRSPSRSAAVSDSSVSMDMGNLADPSYELSDPTPDVYRLFREFDRHFFWGRLACVELKWSARMTRCAGVCSFQPSSRFCSIRLSRPLLTLRPRRDLVQTLLHEMIHGYLFVTGNRDSRQEHGPEFHRHMWRINRAANVNITVYHTFHEEVREQLGHWWRCEGVCRLKPPYFGFVRRSMNRAPSPRDFWWPQHSQTCGGTFVKIREPENYTKKQKGKRSEQVGKTKPGQPAGKSSDVKQEGIRKYFPAGSFEKAVSPVVGSGSSRLPSLPPAIDQPSGSHFCGGGYRLGGSATTPWYKSSAGKVAPQEQPGPSSTKSDSCVGSSRVECPVCCRSVSLEDVNSHLDECLKSAGSERLEDDAVAARAMSDWQRSLSAADDSRGSISQYPPLAQPVIVISDDDDEHRDKCIDREPFSEVMRRFLLDEDDDDVLLAEIPA